jgi:hypothetical protein
MEDFQEEMAKAQEEALNKGTAEKTTTTQAAVETTTAKEAIDTAKQIPDTNKEVVKPTIDWEKETGGKFKSFDEIASLQEKLKDYDSTKEEYNGLKTKLTEYEQKLAEVDNPLKHFGSKEDYVEYQLKKTYPDQKQLIGKLMDIKNLSDTEVLKLAEQFDSPKSKESVIKSYLDDKYGIDINDTEEQDETVLFKISRDARAAREKLAGKLTEVKLPEVDPEKFKKENEEKAAALSKNEESWNNFMNRPDFIEKVFDEIKFQDEKDTDPYYVHKVDPDFKKQLPSLVVKLAKENNIPLTEKNFSDIMEHITDHYVKVNRHKINKSMVEAHKAKWDVEMDKKLHIPGSPNRSDAGGDNSNPDPMADYAREWMTDHKVKY